MPPPESNLRIVAAAKFVLWMAAFFITGFVVAHKDSVRQTETQLSAGVIQVEWLPYAKDPLDSHITVWNKASSDALEGGAILIGAEFSKGVGLLLLDGMGHVLHRWDMENKIYNPTIQQWWGTVTTKEGLLIDDAHLLPGGDVIFIQSLMDVNNLRGQRLARVAPDGHLVWEVSGSFHHFIHFGGTPQKIYTMSARVRQDFPGVGPAEKGTGYLEDWIEVYTMDGKKLEAWSIVDAFAHSPYANWLSSFEIDLPEVQRITGKGKGTLYDLLHLNSVQYLDAAKAKALPQAQEGDLLLSFRAISAIAVFRPSSQQIVWAAKGPWRHQHNVRVEEDGKLYMYDNDGKQVIAFYRGPADPVEQRYSRILRYNASNGQIEEIFSASVLHSVYLGDYQRMADGSWVVSSPQQARVLVVPPDGNVVWQLRTVPDLTRDPIPHEKEISAMHYYTPAELKSFGLPEGVTHVQ